MKRIDKETLMDYGAYAFGLVLVVRALLRKGARDALKTIERSGVTMLDQNGNDVTFVVPSRNPFKK